MVNTLIGFIAEWRLIRTIDVARGEQEESHAQVRRGARNRDGADPESSSQGLDRGFEAGDSWRADARCDRIGRTPSERSGLQRKSLSQSPKGTEAVDEDAR